LEGEIIIKSHWFMKGEKAFDWKERFPQVLIGQEKSSQRGVKGDIPWSLKLSYLLGV
jgi:hypothetical protein